MGRKKLTWQDFAIHKPRAEKIRRIMINSLKEVKSKEIAVLLSSGVDSHACLFAALEAGKTVKCYTFGLEGVESTDWKVAQKTALLLGLEWKGVVLPASYEHMMEYLEQVFFTYNKERIHIGKTTVECMWPMFHALKAVTDDGNKATMLGMGGDVFFATTRKHLKQVKAGGFQQVLDEFEQSYITRRSPQDIMARCWLDIHSQRSHKLVYPFQTKSMINSFRDMEPIAEGNFPIQKAPVRAAFYDYFAAVDVRTHISYQKGDSGISDHFANLLLNSDLNVGNWRSVVGVYNMLSDAAAHAWQDKLTFQQGLERAIQYATKSSKTIATTVASKTV